MSKDGAIEISAQLVHETDDAFLINDGSGEIWVPKSLVTNNGDNTFMMPEWFAQKKGLI